MLFVHFYGNVFKDVFDDCSLSFRIFALQLGGVMFQQKCCKMDCSLSFRVFALQLGGVMFQQKCCKMACSPYQDLCVCTSLLQGKKKMPRMQQPKTENLFQGSNSISRRDLT